MTPTSPQDAATPECREDLILESTIKLWWQRRWHIVRVMTAAIVLFAVILILIPSRYRAEASVIIMPPRFAPEARATPLAVPTAKTLLSTQEIYQSVLQTLKRDRSVLLRLAATQNPDEAAFQRIDAMSPEEIGSAAGISKEEAESIAGLSLTEIEGALEFDEDELEDLNADSIGQMLSSQESVEKKTASDIIYSPVLQLFATSDSGPKAQILVNIWAQLFESKYESLTRGQTQRLYSSLEGQQEAGQTELESIQKILVDFKLKNNLDLLQRQIRDKTDSFSSFSQQLIGRNNEYEGLRAKLSALVELTNELESDKYGWIGSVYVSNEDTTVGSTLQIAQSEPDEKPDLPTTISLLKKEVVHSRRDYIHAINTASQYHASHPLPLLSEEAERIRKEYILQQSDYRTTQVLVAVLQESLDQINQSISETSSVITLSTSLPEEVLGTALVENDADAIRKATSLQLQTEHIHPQWEDLIRRRNGIASRLAEAEAAIKQLEALLPEKEQAVKRAGELSFQAAQGDVLVKQQLERYEAINRTLFNAYGDMKEELFRTGLRMTLLHQEIITMKATIDALKEEIERLRESYESAAAQIDVLNLRKGAIQERAQLLTTKLQESLVAMGEQVNDVSLASKAIAPSRHYFPARSILLVLMTFITAVIFLGAMSRRRYLQLLSSQPPADVAIH